MNAAQQSIGTDVIEEWRDISGFEGLYQVSSLGRIKSLARKVTAPRGRSWFLAARIMSPGFTRKGYRNVSLYKDGKAYPREVHRLVCAAFHGEAPEGKCVAHGDGVPTNNSAENLRWATPQENAADRWLHGTMLVGVDAPRARLTEGDVIDAMNLVAQGVSMVKAARSVGVTDNIVRGILEGTRWPHMSEHPSVIAARNYERKTCSAGHEISTYGFTTKRGHFACRACQRQFAAKAAAKRKLQVRAHLQEIAGTAE